MTEKVRGDQALTVRLVHGDRLLGQHVQPGGKRLDANGCVVVVRSGDQERVDEATLRGATEHGTQRAAESRRARRQSGASWAAAPVGAS